jgi:hypothetical protein
MKIKLIALLFTLFACIPFLQAQKIIALDKGGRVKRIKYYTGDFISLKTWQKEKIEGTIFSIYDSSFVVGTDTIFLREVRAVKNTQRNYGFRLLGSASAIAGAAYLPLTTFNRTINDDSPIVSESALKVSGSFLGVAIISKLIANRHYKISEKRPLKILDLTIGPL